MELEGSVTRWLQQLRSHDELAAQRLWERYYAQLVRIADGKLRNNPSKAFDGEDVALSAFAAFCRAIAEGRYPDMRSRDYLWNLLTEITENKILDAFRRESAQKRGGGRVRRYSDVADDSGAPQVGIDQIATEEPTPEFAAQLTDELRSFLGELAELDDDNGTLQRVTLLKLEGRTNREMTELAAPEGTRMGLRSVERKVKLIRDLLQLRLERTT